MSIFSTIIFPIVFLAIFFALLKISERSKIMVKINKNIKQYIDKLCNIHYNVNGFEVGHTTLDSGPP